MLKKRAITQIQVIYTEDLVGGWTVIWVEGSEVLKKDFTDFQVMLGYVEELMKELE